MCLAVIWCRRLLNKSLIVSSLFDIIKGVNYGHYLPEITSVLFDKNMSRGYIYEMLAQPFIKDCDHGISKIVT